MNGDGKVELAGDGSFYVDEPDKPGETIRETVAVWSFGKDKLPNIEEIKDPNTVKTDNILSWK
jgi:hypothetical protein